MPKIVNAPKCDPAKVFVTFVLLVLCVILTYLIAREVFKMMTKKNNVDVPVQATVVYEHMTPMQETYGKTRCFDCQRQIGASGNPSSCFSCDRQLGPNPDTCFSCKK